MIIEINSSNKNLSYILNKNPYSGFLIKSLRKGFVVGKYINPLTYVCAFEEGIGQDSFEKEGNYLVYRSYCSCEAALVILTSLFDCITKDSNKKYEDGPSLNTIYIPCLDINVNHLAMFNTNDYIVKSYSIADECNLVSLSVTSNGSLIDTIRYLSLILFMQVIKDDVVYLQWDRVSNYANIIAKDDKVPFVVRHRLRGILDTNLSKKVVPLLNNDSIKLSNIGRNENQRMQFVSNHINNRQSVLDIGCGLGKYIKVCKPIKYIGVDVDETVLEKAKTKAEYLNVDASFYTNYKEALDSLTENTTVLLIEVLEHMDQREALNIVLACIVNSYVEQILISTPNRDFNKYFNLAPEQVRYEDHLFEFTQEEFTKLFSIPCSKIVSWGDSVDNVPMTLYANINFKHKLEI